MRGEGFSQGHKVLTYISLISLAIYLLVKLSVNPISKIHFEVVFILLFFGGLFSRKWQIRNDTALRLIALGVILPIVFFLFNYVTNQELAIKYFEFDKLVKLMGFVAIGFWLGGTLRNIYIFLSVVFLGLVVALFNVDATQAFKQIFSGERVDFDIQNAQHTAMFFGLAIIAFISFYGDLLISQYTKQAKFLITVIFVVGLAIVTIVFIGAQTRASLLAMDIVFVISIIHFLIYLFKNGSTKSLSIIFLTYMLFTSTVLINATSNILSKRGAEAAITEGLSKGSMDNIPMTSLGIRLNTWIEASKWIKEKPLHGWGGGVRTHVIQDSNFSDKIKKHIGHFHNSYIEFTLAYGVLGLFFVVFIYYWVNRSIYLLSHQNFRFRGVWYFTLYGSIFMAIINIFESYVFFRTGVYATAVLLAPAYSLYLSNVYQTSVNEL